MNKKISIPILTIFLILSICNLAYPASQKPVSAYQEQTVFQLPNKLTTADSLLFEDKLYIPLRSVSELLGYAVQWEPLKVTLSMANNPSFSDDVINQMRSFFEDYLKAINYSNYAMNKLFVQKDQPIVPRETYDVYLRGAENMHINGGKTTFQALLALLPQELDLGEFAEVAVEHSKNFKIALEAIYTYTTGPTAATLEKCNKSWTNYFVGYNEVNRIVLQDILSQLY